MRIGLPKEIKNHEYRVGLVPSSVNELVAHGHEVAVETHAGYDIGLNDDHYQAAGANILPGPEEVFSFADMIIKVKEPQPVEISRLRPGQILFTYLHLAPDLEQTRGLINSGCTAIAYETVTDAYCHLPLLVPMSEVAGRMSIHAGAHCLEKAQGGNGMLLGGVPGVPAANVVILGGGVVGANAARMAIGLQAKVSIFDVSLYKLYKLDMNFGSTLNTIFATRDAVEEYVLNADLVIGAVLVTGATAPKLITRKIVSQMKRGSVLVDVAIDQGGCFETSRPTTHANPTYVIEDVVHYCVANMPGAVARTSTFALNNATLPFTLALANKGLRQAMLDNEYLRKGLNIYKRQVTYKAVAEAHGLAFTPVEEALQL
ncbi:alanine dehydrogenase [Candidatus Endolissoclinum faulkneri L5]|uniref:Alanine dehydrogenase n=1 Tax=Candidatus Endolissoclinum faulkneri L5 TaxID=1401328 RepID=V9TW03_9PROT|nr:alanine dehydrogenase [Candidatus Endolissoclinum faulkneri]AHC73883.1 alanine dehydrogenase [Candidatus Endolissoclinum faulkneri L5]